MKKEIYKLSKEWVESKDGQPVDKEEVVYFKYKKDALLLRGRRQKTQVGNPELRLLLFWQKESECNRAHMRRISNFYTQRKVF